MGEIKQQVICERVITPFREEDFKYKKPDVFSATNYLNLERENENVQQLLQNTKQWKMQQLTF